MKITIDKLAEMAGTSRGAVDKVIHNRPGVRADVRMRILKAIEETGYIPVKERKLRQETIVIKTIAAILPPLTNPFFGVFKRYLDEIAAYMPSMKLEYHYCDTTDVAKLLDLLDKLEEHAIDGYFLRGTYSSRLCERLNRIDKPIIFFEADVPQVKRLCFIGEDCVQSGRLAASLLAKSIGYAGQIAVITGLPDVPSHKQRLDGFLDVMYADYPQIRVVRQIYSLDQPAIAYEQTVKLLRDFPQLNGLCNLAGCAGEIGQVILETNKQTAVSFVCFSTANDVTAMIRKKVVTFSIGLMPREQARLVLETMYNFLYHNQKPEKKFINTPLTIAVDENIRSLITDFGEI